MSDRAIGVEECWQIDKTQLHDKLEGERRYIRVRLDKELYNLSLFEAEALHREMGRQIRSAKAAQRRITVRP
jgi:hypothetical protein